MQFIATFKLLAITSALSLAMTATAREPIPTVARDPVLGLRFNISKVKFDPLPESIFKKCADLVNENTGRKSWIFAYVSMPAANYYVIGGYFIRHDPVPSGYEKYPSDKFGALLRITADRCEMVDPASESFTEGGSTDLPVEILDPLAADLRRRLEQAFGGPDELRKALHSQRIDLRSQAPSVQRAFGVK